MKDYVKRFFYLVLAIVIAITFDTSFALSTSAASVIVTGDIIENESNLLNIFTNTRATAQKDEILMPIAGSGCVIEYENKYIYGLVPKTTSLTGYIDVASGFEIYYIPNQNGFGTGTVVDVTKDGATVESFSIIIYGDVNGDANIDSVDAGRIVDYENNLIDWGTTNSAACKKAGDIDGDSNVDSLDAGIAVDVENSMCYINQSTGIHYSSIISFDSAGGSAVDTIMQNYSTSVATPTPPTKTGYTFAGWLPDIPATMPAKAINCVAQWTINQYSVTFDSAGGTALEPITQNYNTTVAVPTPPTKIGYTFGGWLPVVPSSMPAKATNCLAQWIINYYTITFDANGGTGSASPSVAYGVIPTPPNVRKLGFSLANWSPEVIEATSAVTYTAQWTPYNYVTGDIIEYGSYPQTEITDNSLIANLESETLSSDNTVTFGGYKYKRVYFTNYTTLEGGLSNDPNNTEQDNNGYYINKIYWFKFEPIKWRVLSYADNELFVMALKILDSNQYCNQPYTDVTWETSTMRAWLNSDFYSIAFDLVEQSTIKTSIVVNEDNIDYGTFGGVTTNDKLFLLSQSETANPSFGFNANYNNPDTSREAIGTDFSKCSGLYVIDYSEFSGNSIWWLRSPGYYQNYVSNVDTDGYGGRSDNDTSTYIGVRPALRINTNNS